jgi:hypothetical protein
VGSVVVHGRARDDRRGGSEYRRSKKKIDGPPQGMLPSFESVRRQRLFSKSNGHSLVSSSLARGRKV